MIGAGNARPFISIIVIAAAPMAMTPVPMAPMPSPVPAPVTAAMPVMTVPVAMMPAYLLDLRALDILRRRNRRLGFGFGTWWLFRERRWRRRHGLRRTHCHDRACGHTQSDLQEVTSFHVQSLLVASRRPASPLRDERHLN